MMMCCSDTIQRSFWNNRTYCVTPAKWLDGKVRDSVSYTLTVHSMVPR
jgi:hypothetical protein